MIIDKVVVGDAVVVRMLTMTKIRAGIKNEKITMKMIKIRILILYTIDAT